MTDNVERKMVFRSEITLGTLLVLGGMAASAGSLLYEIGATRTELADGIHQEIAIRELQTKSLDEKITSTQGGINDRLTLMQNDMRDFRSQMLNRMPSAPR